MTFAVHPDNHRCFLYRGRPFKILTSAEHYGAVLNADFDYEVYLEEMRRTGQNMTRLFTFYRETEGCIPEPGRMNTLAPGPEASVLPWQRVSGHGKAADGLDRFDLDRWNPAYFERLKDFLERCSDCGVVCEITLFCHPYDRRKYDLFPCSAASNVNGVGADLEDPKQFLTLSVPGVVAFQERFVRKIVKELNSFDNIYYEICNEPNISGALPEGDVVAWHTHLARSIRQIEDDLPKRHLIAANPHAAFTVADGPEIPIVRHEDFAYFENPDIDIVNYHYISRKRPADGLNFYRPAGKDAHAGFIWHFMRRRDRYVKPIVFDETYSGIVRGAPERYAINRAEAWEMLLSGGAGYNNLDWSFTPADETGAGKAPLADGRRLDGRCLRQWFQVFRGLLDRYDPAGLAPAAGLLSEEVPGCGYAASTDGEGHYILYFVDERVYLSEPCTPRSAAAVLNLPAGGYAVRTFGPRTGAERDLPELRSDGTAELRVPEFAEDVAVLIDSVN